MSWFKEVLVDYIRAKLANGKTRFGNIAAYDADLNLSLINFTDDNDIPNLRAVRALYGAFVSGLPVPFAAADSVSIDWQTDFPPGAPPGATYADVFGNMYPKPFVYDDTDQSIPFNIQAIRATPGDPTSNIVTVIFSFGLAATGTIQF